MYIHQWISISPAITTFLEKGAVEIEGKYWLYEQLAVSSIPADLYTDDSAGTLNSDAEE